MKLALLAAVALVGCSRPPDLDRVLGHTPEEVRDYLGDPESSSPESEDYRFKVDGNRDVILGVVYRGGRAIMVVTLGALGTPKWSQQQFTDWLGSNCTIEIEPASDVTPPPGVEVGFAATVRPPCTPRVY